MAKVLLGVTFDGSILEATYHVTIMGSTSVQRKNEGWSFEIIDKCKQLLTFANIELAEIGQALKFQLYTEITDTSPTAGSIIDFTLEGTQHFRGKDFNTTISTLRDEIKQLVMI